MIPYTSYRIAHAISVSLLIPLAGTSSIMKGTVPVNGVEAPEYIEVFGAREHNLKNVDIAIPKNKLVVITGISGSGKS